MRFKTKNSAKEEEIIRFLLLTNVDILCILSHK